jgi:hypothetical protein
MTEDQIERSVERKMDSLDARFMNSSMSQAEYDNHVKMINAWAEAEYRAVGWSKFYAHL